MRIFALELNNDIKGLEQRKKYIESLISQLPSPDIVFLPELALCSYMASQAIWQYADKEGQDTAAWAMAIAEKYHIYLGVGYLDEENGDYYNHYLIADKTRVYGSVTKCEGESAVFKRGWFDHMISTPLGNIAVGICYDAKRKHLYDVIKDETLSLIVFPHGSPADPKKADQEIALNDEFCSLYQKAFHVPVVYVNSVGKLEYMPGIMGKMMQKAHFMMNGRSKIYDPIARPIFCSLKEAVGAETEISPKKRCADIPFYGKDLIQGNWLFRFFILNPDVRYGVKQYQANKDRGRES